MQSVAEVFGRCLDLNTAQVRDDLPNLFVRHPHALPVGSVGGHDSAWNSLTDVSKQIAVRVSVTLVRSRKIGTTAAAARAKPVA